MDVASELDLLLVGGGHSHVAVLRALAMAPIRGVRVTLVSREVHTPYSGMLPGHVAGLYARDDIHIDLGPLAAAAGARLIHAEVSGVDPEARRVQLLGRPGLRYDVLSLDTGSTPALEGIEGATERLLPVKPISRFLPRLDALLLRLADATRPLDVAVVGAGAGGVELVLALALRLRSGGLADRARLHLVCAGERPLPSARASAKRRFERALAEAGVRVHRSCRVARVTTDALIFDGGGELVADEVLWVTQAAAPDWARRSGLAVDALGFVEVGPTLQSRSHPDVFAAGDLAMLVHAPRPRSGVYAVRAGPVLAHNLRAYIRDTELRNWQPQRRALYLVTTGGAHAVIIREGVPALAGHWVWRLKNWIDRRFMARFTDLPAMSVAPEPSDVAPARGGGRLASGMRCTGCGSKLGTGTLLAGLGAPGVTSDVGTASFEDAARLDGSELLQTLDGFPLPLPDPWLSGRIAAIHALGDIHAMGAQPVAALAFAVVPWMAPDLMADELSQIMAGVRHELEAHGCALVGGHSCEGAQAMVALALTGRATEVELNKGGGGADEALILTKALGTGVVLAATAEGLLPSRDREAATKCMLMSNREALPVLRDHGVRGCTDVTGFGLLGHGLEMATAAGLSLELLVGAAAALPGALDAFDRGAASSLQADNEALFADVLIDGGSPSAAALRLLADPQTCGGLLAAVAHERVPDCLSALRAAGYADAVVVGRLRHSGGAGPAHRVIFDGA